MDEFEFLDKMYFRLSEARKLRGNTKDESLRLAHDVHCSAIKQTIRDFIKLYAVIAVDRELNK